MLEEESVYGFVPLASELIPAGAVPPVFIELAIRKARKFRKAVADALEYEIKENKVAYHERKGEIQQAFRKALAGIGNVWHDIVLRILIK